MSYFIYTDLISSLLDPRLVNPGSILIHVGAYDPNCSSRNLSDFCRGVECLVLDLGELALQSANEGRTPMQKKPVSIATSLQPETIIFFVMPRAFMPVELQNFEQFYDFHPSVLFQPAQRLPISIKLYLDQ